GKATATGRIFLIMMAPRRLITSLVVIRFLRRTALMRVFACFSYCVHVCAYPPVRRWPLCTRCVGAAYVVCLRARLAERQRSCFRHGSRVVETRSHTCYQRRKAAVQLSRRKEGKRKFSRNQT